MIVEIEGSIGEKRPGYVVIRTASGLSYGLDIPRETEDKLAGVGEVAHLFTHLLVREDHWRLIGFASVREREVFLDLLEVNGVGAKGALALMSHLGIGRLREAVFVGDWKALKGAPGVGAKIAQRVQLELMGRWAKSADPGQLLVPTEAPANVQPEDEVVSALVGLGYRVEEAQLAVKEIPSGDDATRLRLALKALDRGRTR